MPENYITIPSEKGSISISEDVIAAITCGAIAEIDDVAGLSNTSGSEIYEFLGKRSNTKGVKVSFDDGINVDIFVMVRYGKPIASVGAKVQNAVSGAIEPMTGIKPGVNVHVSGIVFDK